MELTTVDDFRSDCEIWFRFGTGRNAAIVIDGLHSTRPVECPLGRPSEAEAMFDVLTYQNGQPCCGCWSSTSAESHSLRASSPPAGRSTTIFPGWRRSSVSADGEGKTVVLVMFTVCPWHDSPYDVHTGRMTRGPQGIFAKIPGVGAANKALIVLLSLRRGSLTERDGRPFVK